MNQTLICDAIRERKLLSFLYQGKRREVEPHLLGYDSDGDLTLSAWQLSGGSGQGWRDFHVSKLSGPTKSLTRFLGARPGYNPNDRTLRQIVCRL